VSRLLWLLALAALAVGLSLAARFNDGYLLLVLPPYRAEISLNLTIILLLLAFVLFYACLRVVVLTISLPQRARRFRARRRGEKAAEAFRDALRLELRAQQGCGNWPEVLRLTRLLEERAGLAPELVEEIRRQAHRENIRCRQSDLGQLLDYLQQLPASENSPDLARMMAEALLVHAAHEPARCLIEAQLDRQWDSALLGFYGQLPLQRAAGFGVPVVAPFDDRRHRHQDRLGAPARLQAEQRAAVPDQVELDVAAAPVGLEVALAFAIGQSSRRRSTIGR
jgi:uncharacterized protein HemY